MALLTYGIDNNELNTFGTLVLLQINIPSTTVTKLLSIASDPLIDPSIINPASGYQTLSL